MKYRIILFALALWILTFPAEAQYRVVASCPGVTDIQPAGSSGGIPVVDTKGNACGVTSSTNASVNVNQISGVSANSVSTVNSTTTPLGNGGVFTGTSEDISAYSSVSVSLLADQVSATNGLSIQQSADGTNWDMADIYTIPASTGKTFGVQVAAKFLRVVYTNGATPQGAFRLQTIMHGFMQATTSQRASDAFSNENDLAETMAFAMCFNGTTWDRCRSDPTTTGAGVYVVAPTSSSTNALSHGSVTALGTSLLAKASAGNLYGYNCTGITGTITAGSSYCVAYNAASVPGTGALTGAQVLDVCTITTSAGCSLSRIPMGIQYGTGIVVLLTSAATPFTYTTGTNTGFISADYK